MTRFLCLFLLVSGPAAPLLAQGTSRASVGSSGQEANAASLRPVTNGAGTSVVFQSAASNLVASDTNGVADIFWRNLTEGTTQRVSVGPGGLEANGASARPSIDTTGVQLVFESDATNLVAGDLNGVRDVFYVALGFQPPLRISVDTNGAEANGPSREAVLSTSGYPWAVAFTSSATNLVAGDANGVDDIFVRRSYGPATLRVSVDSFGNEANGPSSTPSMQGYGILSGRVAFASLATNLVGGDTNGVQDIFLHDFQTGATTRISVSSSGVEANGPSFAPVISADGRYVAFESLASNLVAGDTNGVRDLFLRDTLAGTTTRVSVDALGGEANGPSTAPCLSGDFLAFSSMASNLVSGDTNGVADVFVRELSTGKVTLRSATSAGALSNGDSLAPSIGLDGRRVCFESLASNLVAGDTNSAGDVFVNARGPFGSPGTDLCQAGVGSVLACPCGNPPAGAPQGCDNSAGTGGAVLHSSGSAVLALDTLAFTASGELPGATSILLQGTVLLSDGLVFGQGVRCVGGSLKRLYAGTAQNGSLTCPPGYGFSISARSANLGDPISAGTWRYYTFYYRDPSVLGGCAATKTFNLTQTQGILWD